MQRTDYCGALRKKDVGRIVTLSGWVHRRRDHGVLVFIDLRDREGIVQVVFDGTEGSSDIHQTAHALRPEYVITLRGEVHQRPQETENTELPTGEIEVHAATVMILSRALTPPFSIEDEQGDPSEALRLQYRYLDLRRPRVQKNFLLRHKLTQTVRSFLDRHQFLEIETPFLTKSTPEGARDFLVPSRLTPGTFYALPQSPQLFKQLLMISGFDRYYQIVRCFRDEDLRADRQPEFTQIDMEMSFIEPDDIMALAEQMVCDVFQAVMGSSLPAPFPRLTYQEAMNRFGVDKPDLRFGLEIKEISDLAVQSEFKIFRDAVSKGGKVKGINIKGSRTQGSVTPGSMTPGSVTLSRSAMDALTRDAITLGAKGLAWLKVTAEGMDAPIAKFFTPPLLQQIRERLEATPGDLLIFVADNEPVVHAVLGGMRLLLAKQMNLIPPDIFRPLWVTDFPLLEYDPSEGRYVAIHHPFTAPVTGDLPLLATDPTRVRSKAYDIVLNGSEIGGGSIRIHQSDLQLQLLDLLGIKKEEAEKKFGFLLEALQFGAPPHGGIALGLDRFMAILVGAESIRDVIPFPKTQKGICLMTQAPSEVAPEQLKTVGLR